MKAALVGYGYWGKILRHYIEDNKNLELVKICSHDIVTDGFFTEDFDELVHDKEIGILFICTPAGTHFELCRRGLEAGKHIFCEKPTVKSEGQLDELERLAQENNRILYTDYTYIVSPSVRKMKEMLDGCGDIYLARGEISQYGNFYKGDSVYEIVGVHLFSVIAYLFPEAEVLSCEVGEPDGLSGVQGHVLLKLDNGVRVELALGLLNPKKVRFFSVYGSGGSMVFDMMDKVTLRFDKYIKDRQGGYQKLDTREWHYDEFNNLENVIMDFLACVENQSNRENMAVSKMVDRILRKIDR